MEILKTEEQTILLGEPSGKKLVLQGNSGKKLQELR